LTPEEALCVYTGKHFHKSHLKENFFNVITPVCLTVIESEIKSEIGRPARRFQRFVTGVVLLSVLAWSTACHKSESHSANANSASVNAASAPSSTPANANVEVKTEATSSSAPISLATPTDTYKTAYNARKNKDIATLKRVMTKDALGFLKDMAEIDKKTLDDMLKELTEKPQADSAETRNEKINGNRATLEYLDEKGKWVTMDFSKEGNEWKIDLPKAGSE